MNKKDLLPVIIAFVVALLITLIVRWLLPLGGGQVSSSNSSQKGIEMPKIPLMEKKEVKRKKKEIDYFVLITSKEIKKNTKIGMKFLEWKKWPGDAIQNYFIAKDEHDTPMNNGADYSNAMNMWANTDIPNGIPLTMAMLTNTDPVAKAAKEKKKLEEEKKKKEEFERENAFIKKGMRAVTFSIDQRSAASSNMLKPGDLVDVLIMENRDGKTKTFKYNALKILAIDGVTKFDKNDNAEESGLVSGLRSIGASTPKNVTLEIREDMVETMLRQTQNTGLILSLRSQNEKKKDTNTEDEGEESEEDSVTSMSVLNKILSINRADLTDDIRKIQEAKEQEAQKAEIFLNSVNTLNNIENSIQEAKKRQAKAEEDAKKAEEEKNKKEATSAESKMDRDSGEPNYEVISGKIVGEEPKKEKELESVIIYRKLTPSAVQFDETGKVVNGASTSGEAYMNMSPDRR